MTAAQFFVLHILYVFLSSNKTENICGNPYEANIGKSRVYKDKVIKGLLCDLLSTFGLDICSNSLILCPL